MTPDDVLAFWFGGDARARPLANSGLWWKKDDAVDAEIRARFADAIERAAAGGLDGWRRTPRGRLALVVLLDQLSRNAFRGTRRAFTQDALAREVASDAFAAGDDGDLSPVEVSFLLMPFMHAESAAHQARCVEGFERLVAATADDETLRAMLAGGLDYARQHEAIVRRFGRFPHRNDIVGRETTSEERAFLGQPGSSF